MAVSKTNGKSSTTKKENVPIDSNSHGKRSSIMLFFIAPLLFGMVLGAYLTTYLLEEEYREYILAMSIIYVSIFYVHNLIIIPTSHLLIYIHRTNCITTSIRPSWCHRSKSKQLYQMSISTIRWKTNKWDWTFQVKDNNWSQWTLIPKES